MATGNRALSLLLVLSGVVANRASAQQVVAPRVIPEASGADGPSLDISRLDDPVQLERRLRSLLQAVVEPSRRAVAGGKARPGDFTVGSAEPFSGNLLVRRGDVDLFGRVSGNVVVLDGDVILHSGAQVTGDALAIGGRIRDRGGVVSGERRALGASPEAVAAPRGPLRSALTSLAGLTGVLVTLGLLGFGTVLFARPNLEIISDTVSHSLFRSFLTGLLAPAPGIPASGMLLTGLVLSVAGLRGVP